jgi:putative heme iron utilization protein
MAVNQERDFVREAAALLAGARAGTLATVTPGGLPHAALVTPALDPAGNPLLLLSELSAHTRNLRHNPACALLVTGTAADENPQTAWRLMLSAHAAVAPAEAAASYLKTHPYAELYSGFADFHFWLLTLKEAYFVGGFAAAAALPVAALHHEIKRLGAGDCG